MTIEEMQQESMRTGGYSAQNSAAWKVAAEICARLDTQNTALERTNALLERIANSLLALEMKP